MALTGEVLWVPQMKKIQRTQFWLSEVQIMVVKIIPNISLTESAHMERLNLRLKYYKANKDPSMNVREKYHLHYITKQCPS